MVKGPGGVGDVLGGVCWEIGSCKSSTHVFASRLIGGLERFVIRPPFFPLVTYSQIQALIPEIVVWMVQNAIDQLKLKNAKLAKMLIDLSNPWCNAWLLPGEMLLSIPMQTHMWPDNWLRNT